MERSMVRRAPTRAEELDHRATRWLARQADREEALGDRRCSAENLEFLIDYPHRYDEVLEFTRWLAGASR